MEHSNNIPDLFWILVGIGIMVLLCSIGRAFIIMEKGKLTKQEGGQDEKA